MKDGRQTRIVGFFQLILFLTRRATIRSHQTTFLQCFAMLPVPHNGSNGINKSRTKVARIVRSQTVCIWYLPYTYIRMRTALVGNPCQKWKLRFDFYVHVAVDLTPDATLSPDFLESSFRRRDTDRPGRIMLVFQSGNANSSARYTMV